MSEDAPRPMRASAAHDGAVVRRSIGGIEITRRRKHEPITTASLDPEDLRLRTNKVNGSKFLATWGPDRVADWTLALVESLAWKLAPGVRQRATQRFADPVGLADGVTVHTIEVFCDGRYAHAFPAADET